MNCWEISRSSSIKIRSHQGATNKDLTYYLKKKKKKKKEVTNKCTNEVTNKVNTLQKIRKVINAIKGNDVTDKIEIVLSSVIPQDNQDVDDEINELNKNLRIYAKRKVYVL